MGTNFYARKIPNLKEIQKIHIDLNRFLTGEDVMGTDFYSNLNSFSKSFHIGKRSDGWQFLWKVQNSYYESNLNSIIDFFKNNEDWKIYDEYGDVIPIDEFIKETREYFYEGKNNVSRNLFDEFISDDGLRFSTTDFA